MEPDEALDKTDRYKVVWEVLRALRSHDERLDAVINTLDATKKNPRISVLNIGTGGSGSDRNDQQPDATPAQVQGLLDFGDSPVWREAIFARLVKKVGQRMYWDQWAKDVDLIVRANVARIDAILDAPKSPARAEFETFLTGLRGNLNGSITREHAVNMLAQHLVTRPVFRALFEGYDFIQNNAVAKVMERMLAHLDEHKLEVENASLEKFYESVRLRLKNVDDAGRLRFVNELYEKFFKMAFPNVAKQLGIVYTPVEIVDFIIRSVEHVLKEEFDASLSDKGVHVLDPFTGTGTFIAQLLRSPFIEPEDLLRKYTHELHCNEILLLAYYIAAINIESTFHGIHGGDYVPFTGAVLADTFQMTEAGDVLDTKVFTANNDRMQRQIDLDIRVIVGNPPYSIGQGRENDDAQNLHYPTLDERIAATYVSASSEASHRSTYDTYIRAIRWASDRIRNRGVIGFVTNGGFLDSNSADGLRKSLADEFTSIYVYNLRGNQRTAGEQSRREGGKVFGAGSRATVAITLLIKRPSHKGATTIRYRDIGDYLTTEQKLTIVAGGDVDSIEWEAIEPNAAGDWIRQRTGAFMGFAQMGSQNRMEPRIFSWYSLGLTTNRDAWVYNASRTNVKRNVQRMIENYNAHLGGDPNGPIPLGSAPQSPRRLNTNEADISWSRRLKHSVERGHAARFTEEAIVPAVYRPFNRQWVYFDRMLNEDMRRMPKFYPTQDHANCHILASGQGGGTEPFFCLMVDAVSDLNISQSTAYSRYTYEPTGAQASAQGALDLSGDASPTVSGYHRIDNITDEALADYRATYGDAVTKDDIFHYVYGLLHSPDYRTAFASDLKKMLPRIPQVPSVDDFHAFVSAGRDLAALHVGYETVTPYPLKITGEPGPDVVGDVLYDWYRVEKMRYGGTAQAKDRSTVLYNPRITVTGIPTEAHDYMLGSRSAIDWILERYQVKVDKASQIRNDPNDWAREVDDPRYILDLLGRIVRVSVETVGIVGGLPHLEF
jgi:predicted helicase